MGETITGHVGTNENPADVATKVVPGGTKRNHLIGLVLYDFGPNGRKIRDKSMEAVPPS